MKTGLIPSLSTSWKEKRKRLERQVSENHDKDHLYGLRCILGAFSCGITSSPPPTSTSTQPIHSPLPHQSRRTPHRTSANMLCQKGTWQVNCGRMASQLWENGTWQINCGRMASQLWENGTWQINCGRMERGKSIVGEWNMANQLWENGTWQVNCGRMEREK